MLQQSLCAFPTTSKCQATSDSEAERLFEVFVKQMQAAYREEMAMTLEPLGFRLFRIL